LYTYVADKCAANPPEWTHIPLPVRSVVYAAITDWDAGYEAALADPCKAKNKEKRRLFKALVKAIRGFVNQYLRFDPVTDEDRNNMGVPNHGKKPAPKPEPTDHVEFVLTVDGKGHLVFAAFKIAGGKGRGKGRYHGVEIRYWLLALDAPPPVNAEAAGWRSEVCTASPWKYECDGKEIGLKIYVAMRWENPSVRKNAPPAKGPWSNIQGIIAA
jgi:hypothetical protein